MDLAAHGVERLLEEALDGVKICKVALDCLYGAAEGSDGGGGVIVGLRDTGGGGAPDETDVGTCLCEGDGTCSTDTWVR